MMFHRIVTLPQPNYQSPYGKIKSRNYIYTEPRQTRVFSSTHKIRRPYKRTFSNYFKSKLIGSEIDKMDCSSSSYFNRKERCHRDKTYQEVPGKMSYRQEWPIRLCDAVKCASRGEEPKKTYDPCEDDEKEEANEEGPLDRFDQSIKNYLSMDLWGQDTPKQKHHVHPGVLARTTANTLATTEDLATEDVDNRAFAKKLAAIEKHFLFEQALMVAEQAADAAPPELVEEAALASARGYTMTLETDRKPIATEGDSIIEVISYLGITKPKNDYTADCIP